MAFLIDKVVESLYSRYHSLTSFGISMCLELQNTTVYARSFVRPIQKHNKNKTRVGLVLIKIRDVFLEFYDV